MMSTAPKTEVAKPANIEASRLDTNQQTLALAYFAGRHWFPVTWLGSQPSNIKIVKTSGSGKGAKGGGAASTYATCDVAGLVACGPADFLEAIRVNGTIIWSAGGGISRDGSHAEHTGDIVVPNVATFRLHWGTSTADGDWLILNSTGEDHPYYRDQIVLEAQTLKCASSGSVPNLEVLLERTPSFGALDASRTLEGINPVTAIAEFIENDFYGLGRSGLIHSASAATLATALAARTATGVIPGAPTDVAQMAYLSIYLGERQTFGNFLAAILENFDGWARQTGAQLELGRFPHDGVVPADLPELTLHDLVSDPKFPSPAPDAPEVKTDAIVTGPDRALGMQDSWQSGGNDAARDRIKEIRLQTYPRPFVQTSYQQKHFAQELANYYATPLQSCTATFRRAKVGALRQGDLFILNYAPSSLRQIFRITRRTDPARGGALDLTLEAERGLSPLTYVAAPDAAPALPAPPGPTAVLHARLVQLPVAFTGLVIPAVAPLVERPSDNSLGYRVFFSVADATYDDVADKIYSWALRGTLAGDLTTGTLTFTLNAAGRDLSHLADQSDAAQADDTLLLFAAGEIMSIGAVTALGGGQYSVTVLRARQGSLAAAHTTADEVWIMPRAEITLLTHAEFPRAGGTRYFKLPTINHTQEEQDLSAALKITFSFADTRPAAPVLTAVAGTGKAVSLAWTKIPSASEYGIWRSTTDDIETATWQGDVTALRFVDVDVVLDTTYYYWVIAAETDETNSAPSNSASAAPSSSVYFDPTPPSDPIAPTPTLAAGGTTYLTADGTSRSRIIINNPVAMPVGAQLIDVRYRRVGAPGWTLADQLGDDDLGGTTTIDDLEPDIDYDVGYRSISKDAVPGVNTVPGDASPYTAPDKNTGPANPSAFAGHTPSASYPVPPQYWSATQLYACTITFTPSADRDAAYHEYGRSATTVDEPTGAGYPIPHGENYFFLYAPPGPSIYIWMRVRDRTGNYSDWIYTGINQNTYLALSAGTMSSQNSDAVAVSSVATGAAGAGSIRPITALFPFDVVLTLAGGSAEESFSISLTGRGFTTKPDGVDGAPNVASDPTLKARYDWDDGANSSTNAVLKLSRFDGTNTVAGSVRVTGKFFEYV